MATSCEGLHHEQHSPHWTCINGMQAFQQTRAYSLTHSHTLWHTHSVTHTHIVIHTQCHTHAHAHTRRDTHTHTQCRSHARCSAHTHSHTHTHSHLQPVADLLLHGLKLLRHCICRMATAGEVVDLGCTACIAVCGGHRQAYQLLSILQSTRISQQGAHANVSCGMQLLNSGSVVPGGGSSAHCSDTAASG
jgi:hypothetical protein